MEEWPIYPGEKNIYIYCKEKDHHSGYCHKVKDIYTICLGLRNTILIQKMEVTHSDV